MLTLAGRAWGVEPTLFAASSARRPQVEGLVRAAVGRYLNPEYPVTSLTVEPLVRFRVASLTTLDASVQIDRPFEAYRNFSVPKARASLTRELPLSEPVTTRIIFSSTALSLDAWNTDGYAVRNSLAGEAYWRALSWLAIRFQLGPWVQLTKYAQRTDGRDYPGFGLNERLSLYVPLGRVLLEAHLVLDQAKAAGWRNEYTISQRASYRFLPSLAAGLSHDLVTSIVDDETGLAQPFRLTHGRESRVSIFAEWRL